MEDRYAVYGVFHPIHDHRSVRELLIAPETAWRNREPWTRVRFHSSRVTIFNIARRLAPSMSDGAESVRRKPARSPTALERPSSLASMLVTRVQS